MPALDLRLSAPELIVDAGAPSFYADIQASLEIAPYAPLPTEAAGAACVGNDALSPFSVTITEILLTPRTVFGASGRI